MVESQPGKTRGHGHGEHAQSPGGHEIFEAGRFSWFESLAGRLGGSHPILGALGATLLSWVACTGMLIAVGLLVTHVVAYGRIGHWDEHVNVWFVHRRTPLLNSVSADFTLLANTLEVVAVAGLITALLLLRRWGRVAVLLLIGLALELTGFLASNYVVARPRPVVKHLGALVDGFACLGRGLLALGDFIPDRSREAPID